MTWRRIGTPLTVLAELDFDFMQLTREKLPALNHRRKDLFG
jgi:hypothetical protein